MLINFFFDKCHLIVYLILMYIDMIEQQSFIYAKNFDLKNHEICMYLKQMSQVSECLLLEWH